MSSLSRLTFELARALEARRVIPLGAESAPGEEPALGVELAQPGDGAAGVDATDAWIACDLGVVGDPERAESLLASFAELMVDARGGLVSIADRDLLAGGAARWCRDDLVAALERHGLAPVWCGLTDAHGSVGRRAGITCAISRTRPDELRRLLSCGPLSLEFDRAEAGDVAGSEATGGPPRVLIASYEFVGPTRTGGIGTAYTSLAEALAAAGHEVTVLFTGWEEPTADPFDTWVARYRKRGIELERLPGETPESIETGHRHAVRAYEAYRWLRDRDGDFDVVHFPEVLGHGYYAIAAKRLGLAFERTTLVVGTHSSTSWVLEANGTLFQALDDFADDFIERRSVAGCDVLVSPSAYMLDWMRAKGWELAERNFVHQYARSRAVEELAAAPREDAGPRAQAAGEQTTELVFFGRLEPRKGLRVFCDALDLLAGEAPPALEITFLGKQAGIDGLQAGEYLERRSGRWPWPVRLIDDFGQPEAVRYLRSAGRRLTVIPSLADNSPNTVYEALALGIPFIASRVGGTAELIDTADLAASTFDPQTDSPGGASRGALDLAEHVRSALSTELDPPRPSVDATLCRDAHVRWHERIARAPGTARATAPGAPSLTVCLVGADAARARSSRERIERLEPGPDEVLGVRAPADARPASDLVLVMPAGATLAADAVELITRAFADERVEIVAPVCRLSEGERERVPVGGPALAGLIRRGLGDAAFAIRRASLEELGGFDPRAAPEDQAHQLLVKALVGGVAIDPLPEPLVLGVPADALAPMPLVDASRAQPGLLEIFASAPAHITAGLARLTQQLAGVALEREREFAHLYAHRFGRLTLPIRGTAIRVRRLRARLRRASSRPGPPHR